jgi:hypothetical protein
MTIACGQHERQFSILRMLAAAAVCLLVLTVSGPRSTFAQSAGEADLLDGRIGGSVAAFEEKYGEPTNDPGSRVDAERAYANKNYRNLIALAVDATIYSVAFSADVDTTPEEERTTWTVGKATSLAKRFLPDDAACGKPEALPGGDQLRAQCTSEALAGNWDSPDYEDASRAGAVGTLSFTLTLDPDNAKRVTDIAAAVGTMSLAEAKAAIAYLENIKELYDELPEMFAIMDATISGEQTNDQVLVGIFLIWFGAYGAATATEPPAQYADLHEQWVAILAELNTAGEGVMSGTATGDAEAVRTAVGHYYAAVGLYESFGPVLEQALADAGLA